MAEQQITINFANFDEVVKNFKTMRDSANATSKSLNKELKGAGVSAVKSFKEAKKEVERFERRLKKATDAGQALRDSLQMPRKFLQRTKGIPASEGSELFITRAANQKLLDDGTRKLETINRAIGKHESALIGANKAYKKAQMGQRGFNRDLMEFNKRLTIAIQKIITYRLAFGAFRMATQAFRDLIDVTIEMDSVMGDLQKVLQANAETFEMLQDEAVQMAKEYGRSIVEVADSFRVFAQQGLGVSEILERTNAVLLLTSASTMETTEAVEALTAVVKSYPEYMDDAAAAVDKWAAVQARAPVTARDLANAMKNVGIVASQMGVDLDELNGYVAATAEVTRESGKFIGNAFKTIFARYPRSTTIEALQELGIAAMQDNQTMRDFSDVMEDLSGVWDNLTDIQQKQFAQQIGGIRRYQVFMALMKNFDRAVTSTADSQLSLGEAERMANIETDKLKRQLIAVQATLQEMAVAIGEAGLVQDLIDMAKAAVNLGKNLAGNAEVVNRTIKLVFKLTALIGSLIAAKIIWTKVLIPLKVGMVELAGAMKTATVTGKTLYSALLPLGVVLLSLAVTVGTVSAATIEAEESMGDLHDTLEEGERLWVEQERAMAEASGTLDKFNEMMRERELDEMTAELDKQKAALDTYTVSVGNAIDEYLRMESVGDIFRQMMKIAAPAVVGTADWIFSGFKGAPWDMIDESMQAGGLREVVAALEEDLGRKLPIVVKNFEDLQVALEFLEHEYAARDDLNQYMRDLEAVGGETEKLTDDQKKLRLSFIAYKNQLEAFKLHRSIRELEQRREQLIAEDVSVESLTRSLDALKKRRDELREAPKLEDYFGTGKEDPTLTITKFFSTWKGELGLIEHQFVNISDALDRQASHANLMGEGFNRAREEASMLEKMVKSLGDSIVDKREEALKQEEKVRGVLQDITWLQENWKQPLGIITQHYTDIGADAKEIEKEIAKLRELWRDIDENQGDAVAKLARMQAELRRVNALVQGMEDFQNAITIKSFKTTSAYNMQIAALKTQYSGYRKLSSVKALDQATVEKILDREVKIAALQHQSAMSQLNAKKQLAEQENDIKELAKLEIELEKEKIRYAEDLNKIRLEGIEQIYKRLENVQQELNSSISSSLASLPRDIANRRQELEEMHVRRVELERELANAVEANDQAAINSAKRAISELEAEIKALKPVWMDMLSNIGDIFLQKQAERFVEQVMNMGAGNTWGQQFAQIVTGESIKWANNMRQVFVEVGMAGGAGKSYSTEYLGSLNRGGRRGSVTGDFALEGPIEQGMNAGATTAESKLMNAFEYGAVLLSNSLVDPLIRAMGGRGAGAGAVMGGQIGGMLGGAAAKEWLSFLGGFAGPIGTIAGTFLGGIFGNQLDDFPEVSEDLSDEIERNTQAVENNTRQMKLQNQFINAPAGYIAPPAGGMSGGGNTFVFNVNGAQSPSATANEIRNVMNAEYNRQARTIPVKQRSFR